MYCRYRDALSAYYWQGFPAGAGAFSSRVRLEFHVECEVLPFDAHGSHALRSDGVYAVYENGIHRQNEIHWRTLDKMNFHVQLHLGGFPCNLRYAVDVYRNVYEADRTCEADSVDWRGEAVLYLEPR